MEIDGSRPRVSTAKQKGLGLIKIHYGRSVLFAGLLAALPLSGAGQQPETDSKQPLARARAHIDAGEFDNARAILEPLVDAAAPVTSEPAELLEIMRRIRLDFPYSTDQMFERLAGRVPDATRADLERWTAAGLLGHRTIDGQVWYFSSEPANLFRASPEAARRRTPDVEPAGAFDLRRHLERLAAASKTGKPHAPTLVHPTEICPIRHRIRYALRVKDNHPRIRAGAKVRCWLPYPQKYGQQRDVRQISSDPPSPIIAPEGWPQRTAYFERVIEDGSRPVQFAIEFEYVTSADVRDLDPALARPYDTTSEVYREFTAERPPHIVFTPEVRRLASEIVGTEASPLEKARRIFRWISKNIPWCSEMEYSTIPNLSAKGLAARRGDCGVQGMVFITLCRAAGVPARWQSGWQTQPGSWNMHDWSEFYVEPWGWLPADASYGVQEHDDPAVADFYCGHIDPYRLIVNLDYARELHPPKTSFRSEPNDFQRGEIEIDGHNLYYDEWDWTFNVRTEPVAAGMGWIEEAFDGVVHDALKTERIPGAVISVGRRGPEGNFEVWTKAYGYLRTQPSREPMRPDAIFDMASLTKPIATGTSLLILTERGRLNLDDPVGRYLPEFDTPEKRGITLRQLMTHTSGLPAYLDAAQQKQIRSENGFPCREATRTAVRAVQPVARPGEKVLYSCLNAIVCAEVVEAASGTTLESFAAEHVFEPLKMRDTLFSPPGAMRDRLVPSTPAEHGRGESRFLCGQVHDPLAAMQDGVSGNAGLFSTAADLSRFAQMLLNGGRFDGIRILSEETVRSLRAAHNPGAVNAKGEADERGLLWDIYPETCDDGVVLPGCFGHTGFTGTAMRIWPEHDVYVIALTNRIHPDEKGGIEDFRKAVFRTTAAMLTGGSREQPMTNPRP